MVAAWSPGTARGARKASPRLAAIIDDALRRELGRRGYARVRVAEGRDYDGDPALFLQAVYERGSGGPSGTDAMRALRRLREALAEHGEERFPYLTHDVPGRDPAAPR